MISTLTRMRHTEIDEATLANLSQLPQQPVFRVNDTEAGIKGRPEDLITKLADKIDPLNLSYPLAHPEVLWSLNRLVAAQKIKITLYSEMEPRKILGITMGHVRTFKIQITFPRP